LSTLNCFLDDDNIIRVGGRLQNSPLSLGERHCIVLPSKHIVTFMIINYYHLKFLHVGSNNLLYHVRRKFWPLNGRNLTRKVVHNCTICFKNKPILTSQIMGNLPKERVTPTFPFNNCGVDFCGPFYIKFKNQRKGVLNKIYVSVFVCLVTKAIHLDFVSDLTSKAFIACLKRFFGRRGKSANMFSDNGKTFVGTNVELKKLYKIIKSDESLISYFNDEHIEWHFIPPKSPNFGGLWESCVKSFKFHLRRVAGNANLTLEEFLTLLIEIEAVLNSRPLTPLTPDFDNFETLSPGHFLIGRPVTSIVEPQLIDVRENRLTRWQRVSWLSQHIWRLWKRNYLNNLQQRQKWKFSKDNVEIGSLVVIKNDTLPGTKWLTGRIVDVFYGDDDKIRVVNLKLPDGKIIRRNVRQIGLLPVN